MRRNLLQRIFCVGDFQRGLLVVMIANRKSRCVDRNVLENFDARSR